MILKERKTRKRKTKKDSEREKEEYKEIIEKNKKLPLKIKEKQRNF